MSTHTFSPNSLIMGWGQGPPPVTCPLSRKKHCCTCVFQQRWRALAVGRLGCQQGSQAGPKSKWETSSGCKYCLHNLGFPCCICLQRDWAFSWWWTDKWTRKIQSGSDRIGAEGLSSSMRGLNSAILWTQKAQGALQSYRNSCSVRHSQ